MSVATRLRKTYGYLRWTLKPPRYAGKIVRSALTRGETTVPGAAAPLAQNEIYDGMRDKGFSEMRGTSFQLPEVDISPLTGKARDIPFYNALPLYWNPLKSLTCDILREPRVVDTLLKYFDSKPWLWNVALNYSEPSNRLQDSQLWHFDYGDVKQLHMMLYFSDVDLESGPFTFFPADVSDRVERSKFEIERFTDADLRNDFGIDAANAVRLTGKRQDCFFSDPGRTLHQGARCSKHRLVLFVTFTTPAPMSLGGSKTLRAAERRDLFRHYQATSNGSQVFREEFFL